MEERERREKGGREGGRWKEGRGRGGRLSMCERGKGLNEDV